MPTWLLVGASVRALAASAARARVAPRLIAVDLFGDRDLLAAAEWRSPADARRGGPTLRGCLATTARLCAEGGVDAVVPGGGLEHHPSGLEGAAGRVPVLWSGAGAVEAVRDPGRLHAALRAAGLAYPRTWLPSERPEDDAGPFLLKPRRSGGGRRVRPWRPGTPVPRGALVQSRVQGPVLGAAAVGDGAGASLMALALGLHGEGAFGARGFAYAGSLVGPVLGTRTARVAAEAEAAAGGLAAAFGLRGLFGVDLVLDGGRLVVLEVNPRYTASMELAEGGGPALLDLHLDGLAGRLPREPIWRRFLDGPVRGKGIVYTRRAVTVGDTDPWLAAGWRDVPAAGSRIPAGAPVCTILGWGREPAEALGCLRREADLVRAALARC